MLNSLKVLEQSEVAMQPRKTLTSICVFTLGIGFVSLLAPATLAQSLNSSPFQDQPADLNTLLNGNSGTGGASLLNLLNQIRLLDGRNPAEVAAEQQENLNNAAEAFRRKQQQQLQEQPSLTPAPQFQPGP